jgi:tail protein
MPLADLTFKLGDNGFVLNSDISLPFVDIDRVSGLDSPPFRETVRDHEGTDGGYLDAEFEKGRDLSLEGTAYCDVNNVETFLDTIKANYAPVRNPVPFYVKADGSVAERVLFVKPRGVRYDWDLLRRTGQTPIQFLLYAEDPRIYTNVLQTIPVPFGGLATTGFGFSFGFNLSFGATVPATGATITVGGNRPAPAVLHIVGPIVDPRIINETDSKTLAFVITLSASDTLDIDLANRTVVLNGNVNRRNTLQTPDWFLFNPGNTFLRFGGASGTGTLSVIFRDAWR